MKNCKNCKNYKETFCNKKWADPTGFSGFISINALTARMSEAFCGVEGKGFEAKWTNIVDSEIKH